MLTSSLDNIGLSSAGILASGQGIARPCLHVAGAQTAACFNEVHITKCELDVSDGACLEVTHLLVEDAGASVHGKGTSLIASNSSFKRSTLAGLHVYGEGEVSLRGCVCRGNAEGPGIKLEGCGSLVDAEDCVFSGVAIINGIHRSISELSCWRARCWKLWFIFGYRSFSLQKLRSASCIVLIQLT